MALNESEQKYQALVETTDTGYVILDAEGRVVDANQEYLRLTGRKTISELLGHQVTEWTVTRDLARNGEEVRKCLETGRVRNLQIDYLKPEGEITPVEINATVVRTSEGLRILTLCKDITERRRAERSLLEMENIFTLFLEHSPVYVFFKDADLRPLRLSRNYEKLLGRPLDQILGRTMDELFPPELAKSMIADDQRIIQENALVRIDETLGEHHYTTIKFPVVQEGKPPFLAGITIDITDRKRAEEALKESEARFRTIFEQVAVGMVIVATDGRFIHVNPAFQAFLGYSEPELQAMSIRDVTHPDFIEADLRNIQACLRGELPYYLNEKLYLRRDGQEVWGRLLATVLRDETGKPRSLVAIIEDISERKVAETALQRSEEKFRTLFQAMIEGVAVHEMVYDPQGKPIDYRIVDVNPAHEIHTGLSRSQCLGKLASELYGAGSPPYLEEYSRVAEDGRPHAFEIYFAPMGKHFRISVFCPQPGFFATVFEDITERKQHEEERIRLETEIQHAQKLESLGSLASGVAHDMNNVLQAIQGMASVLKVKCAEDPTLAQTQALAQVLASGLDIILNASNRGRDLVRNLTDFAHKGLEEPRLLDLNQIIQKEVELLKHTTMQRIELQMELGDPLPQILGDPSAIGNALMNLCINALDAMPEKGVLRFQTRKLESGAVELAVEDSGQGMTPEVQARAMEPFFTTKPKGKGTGLGLSGVYGTMKAHGGSMEIQSKAGTGTRVMLRFRPGPGAPAAAEQENAGSSGPKAEQLLRILLVDDDDLIRDSFPDLMEILGHKVVATAPTGNDALRQVEAGLEVDVVVLDHNMPGLSGIETLTRLQALRSGLPIVFCTGHLDDSVRDRLKGREHVWILMKPYSIKDIRPILSAVTQR
jgi:PAS domain S-box-containing protein